ncbi:HEAT repeat domain-containing protein [Kitasatospora sp. NPDC059747]|uniref:HEAT repeat domain-containing protein n=1 Tax=Kitasatospora sp. NPDC059747 TaxID=3346930 RepID=UPI00364874F0
MTTLNDGAQRHGRPARPDLSDALAVIRDTDWAALQHAYGPAGDTPARLLQLLDPEPETQAEALGMLDMSVLHQGSLYSSTAPAALFVAAILADPRTTARHESHFPWDERSRPLRAALVDWLGQVAESAGWGEFAEDDEPDAEEAEEVEEVEEVEADEADEDEDEEDAEDRAATAACRAIRPTLYAAVVPHLTAPDPAVREAALGAAGHLLNAPELVDRVPEAAQHLRRLLADSADRRERAAAVLTLGAWHQDTAELLDDADPAVRACAALAPVAAADPRATRVLLAALEDPKAADGWFPEPLPQFDGWFRFTLLAAAIDLVDDFAELLPAALALVPLADDFTVERDWGPLLVKALPNGFPADAEPTAAQRAFLRAVAANDGCWGTIGNKIIWLRRVGLPEDRAEFRRLVG